MERMYVQLSSAVKPRLLECLNDWENLWAVRFFVEERSVGSSDGVVVYDYVEVRVSGRPRVDEIGELITDYLKVEEERVMDAGFEWESQQSGRRFVVSLDAENRPNYQSQYIANVYAGVPLSATPYFFGVHSEEMYCFSDLDELNDWYTKSFEFGARVKASFIAKRQGVDLTVYEL